MTTIALIPARAGSKRLPGKNVRKMCGKPLWVWSLEAAQQSCMFDQTWVSTDCGEIVDYHREHGGFNLHIRRPDQAHDKQPTEDVIALFTADTGMSTGERSTPRWDVLCLLQPTSPTRTADDITFAVPRFIASCADSLATQTKASAVFAQTDGAIYCVRREFWDRTHLLVGGKMLTWIREAGDVDIDTEEDWTRAEAALRDRHGSPLRA